jgi:mitochondrial fission protein ELM1
MFDLCIIPAHDRPPVKDNILVTRGVLNRAGNCADKDSGNGLILVGGPSAHVNWSSAEIARQIKSVLERTPEIGWILATSRRTPPDFVELLAEFQDRQLAIVPVEQTGPDWLPDKLATSSRVWVTADSVSMVYEALTSGAAVGLMSVPYKREDDRLLRGIGDLLKERLVTGFEDWQQGGVLRQPAVPFDEARRAANWILERWPDKS